MCELEDRRAVPAEEDANDPGGVRRFGENVKTSPSVSSSDVSSVAEVSSCHRLFAAAAADVVIDGRLTFGGLEAPLRSPETGLALA